MHHSWDGHFWKFMLRMKPPWLWGAVFSNKGRAKSMHDGQNRESDLLLLATECDKNVSSLLYGCGQNLRPQFIEPTSTSLDSSKAIVPNLIVIGPSENTAILKILCWYKFTSSIILSLDSISSQDCLHSGHSLDDRDPDMKGQAVSIHKLSSEWLFRFQQHPDASVETPFTRPLPSLRDRSLVIRKAKWAKAVPHPGAQWGNGPIFLVGQVVKENKPGPSTLVPGASLKRLGQHQPHWVRIPLID